MTDAAAAADVASPALLEINFEAPAWAENIDQVACRYKGARGGRGGGKGFYFADRLIEDCLDTKGTLGCCMREVQRTLQESSKRLIEKRLARYNLMNCGFKIYEDVIETPGDGLIIFRGMQSYNSENIKSLEGYNRFWWDEAQNASANSLDILRPTVRSPGAQIWFSWNPKLPPDPANPFNSVDGLFGQHIEDQFQRQIHIATLPGGGLLADCNFNDNPFLPADLKSEEAYDRVHRRPEDYAHIWKGAYQLRSEARVFSNWKVEAFDTPYDHPALIFLFGADFGFSIDPTVLIRCWTARCENGQYIPDPRGRFLMIDKEAYRLGLGVDATSLFFMQTIPGCEAWPIIADSARPETIDLCRRTGLPRMLSARKGAGSVEDGIEFLKSYTIVIHPSCVHAADEFTFYSWKTDPRTKAILPILSDKKNHVIDAARYAVEDIRRPRGFIA